MRASDTAEGRRAAVARGVIYRVIYGTTKTPFAYRPISDLGESRRSEQMADGWWHSRRRSTFGHHNIESYLLKKTGLLRFGLSILFARQKRKKFFSFLSPSRDGVRLKWASSASAIAFATPKYPNALG